MDEHYGIVANVRETDRVFRAGAKAWMTGWYSGGERATWLAMSRSGRVVEKVAPLYRFDNFRAAWIPQHLRCRVDCGPKEKMIKRAEFWSRRATEERELHPNRGRPPL